MIPSACPACSRTLTKCVTSGAPSRCHSFQSFKAFTVQRATPTQVIIRRRATNSRTSRPHSAKCTVERETNSDTAQQPLPRSEEASTPAWDVVGLGQPMVDFSASVQDDLLVRLGIPKGSRRYCQERSSFCGRQRPVHPSSCCMHVQGHICATAC